MYGKTNKSVTKRLKITRTGKILRRKGGQNHFQAKKSRATQLNKKGTTAFMNVGKEYISRFAPHIWHELNEAPFQ